MNIIKETGHEGEIHGNIQILSMYGQTGEYHIRIKLRDSLIK